MATDPVKLYIRDIKHIPLLTPEEEKSYSRSARKGDLMARKKMIISNLRLVINIAKRYNYLGVPMLDLIEEGNLGLIKAVSKYNPRKGYRFSTYAAWWVRQYITRAIANQGKTIRVPVYMTEIISRWKRVRERLKQKLRRKPSVAEVARAMKLSVKKIKDIDKLVQQTSSLDAPIGESGSGQFMDLIEDDGAAIPTEEVGRMLQHEQITNLLELMSERERRIITLRFGLKDGIARTLEETAKEFGITRERVRQIEVGAILKLRSLMEIQKTI
ncbi:MAG: hypothetical protein AUJ75_02510 [Candidatus Omnitrophica bacterium CG1_02_49_10]|nr:MAG: hypothetical protein AUJ75_02510 [Candidatus Omnitrophica bacterium CG1_02_49_10]